MSFLTLIVGTTAIVGEAVEGLAVGNPGIPLTGFIVGSSEDGFFVGVPGSADEGFFVGVSGSTG